MRVNFRMLVLVACLALLRLDDLALCVGLGIEGAAFTVDGKRQFLLGASYYGALGAPDEFIDRDLDDLKRLGFNWIRVWATWDAFENNVSAVNPDGTAREPYLTKLKSLVRKADRRGMIVDVTLSRGKLLPDQASHLKAVETLAKALKPYRNVYLDLANERDVRDARFVDFPELKALRDRVKATDAKRLVTASGGVTRESLARYLFEAALDFICPHGERRAGAAQETAERTREYLAWMKELGRLVPLHYQEPFRRDYGRWQPALEDFCTDLRNATIGGAAGWCFHNGSPRFPERSGPRRSFDMRPSYGRLIVQLDPVEREFLNRARSCTEP
jgi:hypothetical protein